MKMTKILAASVAALAFAAAAALPDVDAEVRKVDAAKGTVVLKHGDIPNLGMSGMTMEFHAADRKMLQGVKAGDKLKVQIDMVGGKPTVVQLMRAK